ncbi:MAG: hypothetical protein J6B34_06315 [Clostridia bacterium]|nr:hypothetical protein [Clostridia bacterium]
MSTILDEFEDYYNTLDMYLRRIGGYPENKSAIYDYEFVIDPHRSAQLGTIRRFRNSFSGHGNRVGGEMPTPPRSYITFLDEEIKYIQQNEKEVGRRLAQRREENGDGYYNDKGRGRTQYNDNKGDSKKTGGRRTDSTSHKLPKKETPKTPTYTRDNTPKTPTYTRDDTPKTPTYKDETPRVPTYRDDTPKAPTPKPEPPKPPRVELIDGHGPSGEYKDSTVGFVATFGFCGGRGRFVKKGIIKQENVIDFWLDFKFQGACKAAAARIFTTAGAKTVRIKEGINVFELNELYFKDGIVKVQIVFEYKLNAVQTKRGEITVAKKF